MVVIRHLYRSQVEVLTDVGYMKKGGLVQGWARSEHMFDPYLNRVGQMMCRLDLNFLRPGKDDPPLQVGGRAPDRVGVLFCDYTEYLKADMRIKCIAGPIKGIFVIKNIPDEAQDYVGVHHLECYVQELAQSLVNAVDNITPNPTNRTTRG